MAQGKVKYFDGGKGYGFITPDDGSQGVFFHFSAIVSEGEKSLADNTPVEYQVSRTPKGLQAQMVRALGPS
ncbi:cold-shock protein [Pandoraea pneumonica]|uniref:cold-shock protein n=1 Tax=Pandoraea pneumonica TaxID=2508299 RepID=UPI003CED85BB